MKAASKDSSMFIIPESRPYGAVVYIQACSNVYLENLVLRGYKGCTSYNDATLYGVSIQYSKAVLESCCIDFIGHTNVGNVFEIWTSTLISSDCYGGAAYYNGVYRYLNDCYLANLNNWSFWGSLGTKTPHVRSYVRTVSGDYSTPGWNPTQTPNLDLPASINTMELLEISLSSSVNVYCDIDTVSPESASLSTWSYGKYTNAQSGEKLGNGYKYACIMTTDPTTPTDISALLSSKTIVRATILFKMEECWRGATEKALYVFHTGTMPTNGDAYDTHMWTLGKNVSVSQIEECSTDITLEVGYYVANSYHLYGFGLGFEGDYVSVLYPILKVIYY